MGFGFGTDWNDPDELKVSKLTALVERMRIFSLIASLAESGGAEMLVRNLTLEYARRGHECHIAYISDAASLGAPADFENAFKDELDAAGVGYDELGHGCKSNILKGAWRFRQAIAEFDPDVVHIHLGYGLLFQALGFVRRPTVYTHHNIVFKFPVSLFKVFDRFVTRYIGICNACAKLLRRHVSRPVELIRNGVPKRFATGMRRTSVPDLISILSVGNLTDQKDYAILIKAAAILVPHFATMGRTVRFKIAGEGAARPELERLIETLGLEDSVELLGTRRDIGPLMADATLLVMSSVHEGLPITLIEASMSALPAIATDVGGCAEVVEAGMNGILVPPGNPAAIADAVLALLSDDEKYSAASAYAEIIGQLYTLDACVEAHLSLYEEILIPSRRQRD